METIGFVGIGKIGLPIAENLIKSGRRVVGYRRSSLAEFEKLGGVPAHSAAEVGAQADDALEVPDGVREVALAQVDETAVEVGPGEVRPQGDAGGVTRAGIGVAR